ILRQFRRHRHLHSFPPRRSSDLRACAESLEAIEHGDPHLRAAYAACRRSEAACAELLGDRDDDMHYTAQDEASAESFPASDPIRSEEHTSELQSRENLVCRLLLE